MLEAETQGEKLRVEHFPGVRVRSLFFGPLVKGPSGTLGKWGSSPVWGCFFYGALTGLNQVGQKPNASCVIERVLIRLAEFLKHLVHGNGGEFPRLEIL